MVALYKFIEKAFLTISIPAVNVIAVYLRSSPTFKTSCKSFVKALFTIGVAIVSERFTFNLCATINTLCYGAEAA